MNEPASARGRMARRTRCPASGDQSAKPGWRANRNRQRAVEASELLDEKERLCSHSPINPHARFAWSGK